MKSAYVMGTSLKKEIFIKAKDYLTRLETPITEEDINDACNIFATSYEDYMTLYHLLTSQTFSTKFSNKA